MTNTNLREEWLKWYHEPEIEDRSDQTIADWWLSLLEQEKMKWLEALPKEEDNENADYYQGWNDCLKEVKEQLT